MLQDADGCCEMLDGKGRYGMLRDAVGCWGMLKGGQGRCNMLRDADGC